MHFAFVCFLVLIVGVGLMFSGLLIGWFWESFCEWREINKNDHGNWEYRDIKGGRLAIQTYDDMDPHAADVIARTIETGKPVSGTYDDDGNFVITEIDQ